MYELKRGRRLVGRHDGWAPDRLPACPARSPARGRLGRGEFTGASQTGTAYQSSAPDGWLAACRPFNRSLIQHLSTIDNIHIIILTRRPIDRLLTA